MNRNAGALAAALLGLAAFLVFFDPRVLGPTEIGWVSRDDIATNFLGWHFFRHEPWTWPPGMLMHYGQGLAASIALTDSVPPMAFALKPFDAWLPRAFNYLGLWIALSFALQGYFGYRVLERLGVRPVRAAAGAALLCVLPFMAGRATLHVPLASHFLLLAALYVYLDAAAQPRRFRGWSLLLPIAALVNAYLFTTVAAVFLASAWAALSRWREARSWIVVHAGIAGALAVFALYLVGFMSVDVTPTWGAYGQLQMNLLAWINPQGLGRMPTFPVAEIGQTDGYLYLGAGGILVLLAGAAQWMRSRAAIDRMLLPLVVVCIAILLVAISHRVALGPRMLIELPLPSWLQEKMNAFRSSGRLAWMPTYLLLVAALAACARWRRAFLPLVGFAIALNVWDAAPIRAIGHGLVDVRDHRAHPDCANLPASAQRVAFVPRMVLEDRSIGAAWDIAVCAAEKGQPIDTAYLARFNVYRLQAAARETAAALERPPQPHVAYAYRNPAVGALLGAPANVPKMGGYRVFVPGITHAAGGSQEDREWSWPLDIDLGGDGYGRDVELYGWAPPMVGFAWSIGPRAALLLPIPQGMSGAARLQLLARPTPIGHGDLTLAVRANGIRLPDITLTSARGTAWYTITVPAEIVAKVHGALRVELDIPEGAPFEPRRSYPDDRLRLWVSRLRASEEAADRVSGRPVQGSPDVSVLAEGWSGPESWGTWSLGRTARLRLPLPSKRGGALTLRLLAHANAPHGTQEVRVRVSGREVARWSFRSLAPDEWREAVIAPGLLPSGNDIDVELEISDPGPPAIPGSMDTRSLGIGVAAYELGSN